MCHCLGDPRAPLADGLEILAVKSTFVTTAGRPLQRVEGFGFRPAAVIAWWSRQESLGVEPGNCGGMGFWTADRCVSVAWMSADGEPSSRTRTIADTAAILGLDPSGDAAVMQGGLESFDADGVTLRWDIGPTEPWLVHFLALAGDSLDRARAGWARCPPGTAHVDLELPDVRPDLLLVMPAPAELGSPEDELAIGIGAAAGRGQAATGYAYPRGADPGAVTGAQTGDAALVASSSLTAPPTRGVVRAQRERGPSIEWLAGSRRVPRIAYLAVDGIRARVGTDFAPSGPGRRRTRVGFRPHALLLFSWGFPRSPQPQRIGRLCVGGASDGRSGCVCWDDRNVRAAETMSRVRSFDQRALVVADTQTEGAHAEAKVASVDPGGFSLEWVSNDGKAREFAYVAIAPAEGATRRPARLLSRLARIARIARRA